MCSRSALRVYQQHGKVLDMFDGLFTYIFDGLKTRCNAELEIIRTQYPFEDLKYRYLTFQTQFNLSLFLSCSLYLLL